MSKKGNTNEVCLNCQAKLGEDDVFCPKCGQKALHDHLTLKYFLKEFLNNYFSFDSKFFNTVKQLLTKPAFLSTAFIEGKRIRYINPIQLFIFSSFLYFLVNSFMFLKDESSDRDMVRIHDENKNIINDSLSIQKLDSLLIIEEKGKTDTVEFSYLKEFFRRGLKFNQLDKATQNEIVSKNISYAVFLLMPIFALYLGFLFQRKNRKYLENVIFSLHFHTFYYVAGVVFLFLDRFLTGDLNTLLLNLICWIYLLIALKKFYQFSWGSTILRQIGLTFIYGFTAGIFLFVSIILSVIL